MKFFFGLYHNFHNNLQEMRSKKLKQRYGCATLPVLRRLSFELKQTYIRKLA